MTVESHDRTNQTATRVACLLILLLAFALRAYHLDFQSLWSDEGISLARSSLALPSLLQAVPVEHVPGYFVLLHFWLRAAGDSDFALRLLSLWPSVLAVALIYRLGADFGSRPAGLTAALLASTSFFQIWYAQDARMYSWLLAAGLLSNWLFWRLLAGPQPGSWGVLAAYVLSTAATIYIHYYGFLIPLVQALYAVGWVAVKRDWRVFGRWALAGLAVFILFLPWLPRAALLLNHRGWREPIDPRGIPASFVNDYLLGQAVPNAWQAWLLWLYLALTLVGVVAWWRWRRSAALFLAAGVLIPLGVVLGLALTNPDFHVRYTIFVAGPLLLLVGGGVTGIYPVTWRAPSTPGRQAGARWRSAALVVPALLVLGVLVTANARAVQRLYTETGLHKPDFRAAALYIQQHERAGDVIVVDGPNPELVFLRYYQGDLPVHDLRPLLEASEEELDATMAEATAGASRVWELLLFHDPGPVQAWLARHSWAGAPTYHNDIRVALYGLDDKPLQEKPLDVLFGDALRLTGVGISDEVAATDDLVRISTTWQVLAQPPEYKFSLRLLDGEGNTRVSRDYVPQNWFWPTSAWPAGATVVDQHGLEILPDFAPGRYRIALRLYDPADGTPVETELGQDVTLHEIEIR